DPSTPPSAGSIVHMELINGAGTSKRSPPSRKGGANTKRTSPATSSTYAGAPGGRSGKERGSDSASVVSASRPIIPTSPANAKETVPTRTSVRRRQQQEVVE
ncbi:unnamed protein product, partial [Discosporangium mesarthrocarpum]